MTENDASLETDPIDPARACFIRLVQVTLGRYAASGAGAAHAERMQRLEATLQGLYPEFQRNYARLFAQHVGADQAGEVLRELQHGSLRLYSRARASMQPEFAARLEQLKQRMGRIEV